MSDMIQQNLKSTPVGLIGIFPPPSGGQGFYNLHIYRELLQRGWPVLAVDVSGSPSPSGRYVNTPTRVRLVRELSLRRYACLFLTASDSRCLGFELLTAVTSRIRNIPFIYNILAGRFTDRFREYGPVHRSILRFAVNQACLLLVSNETQARDLTRITTKPTHQIRVIGCRVPVGDTVIDNPELIDFLRSGNPGIISVGAMRDTYGFPLLIEACSRLTDSGFTPSLLLVVSGIEDPRTGEHIKSVLKQTGGTVPVHIHRELPRSEVLGAVRAADLLVRPTRFDGDSLTIHEAIELGTPVVASDAAPRPPGVYIHRADDVESLRDSMIAAIRAPSRQSGEPRNGDPVDHIEQAFREITQDRMS